MHGMKEGRMEKYKEGWMHGRKEEKDGWMEGKRVDGWMEGSKDGSLEWKKGRKDGWMNGREGRKNGSLDRWKKGREDGWKEGIYRYFFHVDTISELTHSWFLNKIYLIQNLFYFLR
ncbi:hypothetical protein CEXT_100491 [Caerostris extrusa]|uniref:Uncharacterized protein n=1 Tax=Caerostris extrusa TaxID=172846 RepID=A0AAV4NP67_CAEEX|nr:hypothetical protein CEXT_100491 [Caerostris extrusa]